MSSTQFMGRCLAALATTLALLACSAEAPPAKDAYFIHGERQRAGGPEGMVWIPSGTYWMGADDALPDEAPAHPVRLEGFWLDATEVTNAEFARFVEATGYVTIAERPPSVEDFPELTPEERVPGSLVFTAPDFQPDMRQYTQWWRWQESADWRHPEGPGSSIEGRMDHPVVQVAWDDAVAYAEWAGKRLPTEAEWEWAARLGSARFGSGRYPEPASAGKWKANIFQGSFPLENRGDDGFLETSPVGSFEPDALGLSDMAGNVWEWVADWYRPDAYGLPGAERGAGPAESFDPAEPGMPKRVIRGGSFLCNDSYCAGYRPCARMKSSPDTGLNHTGFRCARSPE